MNAEVQPWKIHTYRKPLRTVIWSVKEYTHYSKEWEIVQRFFGNQGTLNNLLLSDL